MIDSRDGDKRPNVLVPVSAWGGKDPMTRSHARRVERGPALHGPADLPVSVTADLMLASVIDALPIGMFWKDRDSRILGCNQKFAEDSGATDPAELIGKTNFDFCASETAATYRADDLEVMNSGLPKLGIEEPLLLSTGAIIWIETNKVPLRNAAGEIIGVLGTYRDVTARHKAANESLRMALELAKARQAARMSQYDPLTGLPNRRYLQEELARRVASLGHGAEQRFAIVAVDLDRFKAINDLYGHAAGDELLREVARRLSENAATDGFAARLGGDEFVMIVPFGSDTDLDERLSVLRTTFETPIAIAERQLIASLALGVATAPADGIDPDVLMRRADMALYCAKEYGGRKPAFFQPEMEFRAKERALLEHDLRIAIRQRAIIPFFQPILDLRTGRASCYEVLARWPHAERGLVPPDQFIQIAIDAGLIGELTWDLLRRACLETKDWPGAPRIAINVAAAQLRDDMLTERVLDVLSQCGFPASRLEIEITEDALVTDIATARSTLASLKNAGVQIVLDDFGTGYSSLQHLNELPFDALKIDQSFVRSMNDHESALMMVKTISQLARNMGLGLIAEGIETEEQLAALVALGCERGQGFHLGRPQPGIARTDERDESGAGSRKPRRERAA
jgi:diguanylate cyclase (GGDEF)-like protein/PAS domain S-box-containing protein